MSQLHLALNPLFRGLSEENLERIFSFSSTRALEDGEVLFRQGEGSDDVYIVRRGSIRISAVHDGAEEVYANLALGDIFGEIGVLKYQGRSATATAVGEASVLVFAGEDFQGLVEEFPSLAHAVTRTMFARFRNDQNRAERRAARAAGGKVFPIFSATGGAGRTMVTANLAGQVRDLTHSRVLVFDLDLMFGDQINVLGGRHVFSMVDIALQPTIGEKDVLKLVQRCPTGVDLLCAPKRPEEAESLGAELMNVCLDYLVKHYDYIFCDTSTDLREISLDLFERAFVPLYVLTPSYTSIRHAMRWMDLAERIGLEAGTTRFLVNQVDPEDAASLEFVEKRLGQRILDRFPLSPAARLAMNNAQLVDMVEPTGALNQSLRRAAGKLVGLEIAGEDSGAGFWKGWL